MRISVTNKDTELNQCVYQPDFVSLLFLHDPVFIISDEEENSPKT